MDFDKLLVVLAVANLGVMALAGFNSDARWCQRVMCGSFYLGLAILVAVLVRIALK